MTFNETGTTAFAKMYLENGKLAAEGYYYQSVKDSIWRYYSSQSCKLLSTDTYNEGVKNGNSQTYYPNGNVSEELNWVDDKKSGIWKLYFDDGKIQQIATFLDRMQAG